MFNRRGAWARSNKYVLGMYMASLVVARFPPLPWKQIRATVVYLPGVSITCCAPSIDTPPLEYIDGSLSTSSRHMIVYVRAVIKLTFPPSLTVLECPAPSARALRHTVKNGRLYILGVSLVLLLFIFLSPGVPIHPCMPFAAISARSRNHVMMLKSRWRGVCIGSSERPRGVS
jgi:hypothetical protein